MTEQNQPIEVEATPTQAVAVRESGGALGRALSIEELHRNLEFIRDVMRKEMREGTDYGMIPGTRERPTLLQPGAQKLLMTFNLTEAVKKEVLREYPGYHREYEFTIVVRAQNGKEWDGVGTCSTLEEKYRYRKVARQCPACGKDNIRKSKQGDGWYCWAKTGGCGANFAANNPFITAQTEGKTENENPADCWNTVRKMAFKRGLVAAAINATNTSELWTQDLEEKVEEPDAPQSSGNAPPSDQAPEPPSRPTPPPAAKTGVTGAHLARFIQRIEEQKLRERATQFCIDLAWLLPTEKLEDLPLRFVPQTKEEFTNFFIKMAHWATSGKVDKPYPPHEEPEPSPKSKGGGEPSTGTAASSPQAPPTGEVTGTTPTTTGSSQPTRHSSEAEEQPWYKFIVPIPRKGMKRDIYLKNPDTIGSLYEARHGSDADSRELRQRLWGFVKQWKPEPWIGRDGKTRLPAKSELVFRQMLDAFGEWWDKYHPGEDL